MKRLLTTSAPITLLLISVSAALAGRALAQSPPYAADRIIVRFTPDAIALPLGESASALGDLTATAPLDSVLAAANTSVLAHLAPDGSELEDLYLAYLSSAGDVLTAVAILQASPSVLYAEPDYIGHVDDLPPADVRFDEQWSLSSNAADCRALGAWTISTGSYSVRLGILDTGADFNHGDLGQGFGPDQKIAGGYNFLSNNSNVMDDNYHGTMMASIAAGLANNAPTGGASSGIAGIAGGSGYDKASGTGNKGVAIYAMKIGTASGAIYESQAVRAVIDGSDPAGAYRLRVLNNSWAFDDSGAFPIAMADAVGLAARRGVVVVASRGNENNAAFQWPACYASNWVISVGATNRQGQRAQPGDELWFDGGSDWGHGIDIVAPGTAVLASTPLTATSSMTQKGVTTQFASRSGTSQAAALVSGLASLLFSVNSNLLPEDVESIIRISADDIPPLGYDDETGAGRVNAHRALSLAQAPWQLQHLTVTGGGAVTTTPIDMGLIRFVATDGSVQLRKAIMHEVVRTVFFPFGPSATHIWGLGVNQSTGWHAARTDGSDRVWKIGFCDVKSRSSTSAVLRTYVYQLFDPVTQNVFLGWTPCAPTEVGFAYGLVSLTPQLLDITDASPALRVSANGRGVSWGDVNNDGREDLFLANNFSPNRLFLNAGGSTFYDSGQLVGTLDGLAGVWADYDNDGWLDLYVVSETANQLFHNSSGSLVATANSGTELLGARAAAWVDYDSDGKLDLFVTRNGAANRLLRGNGVTFTDVTSSAGDASFNSPAPSGYGASAAFCDYDGDGDQDLYLVNSASPNRLFRNDSGHFLDVTTPPLDDAGNGAGAAWGDYNNDGTPDLFLTNFSGQSRLFKNVPSPSGNSFVDVTSEAGRFRLAEVTTARTSVAWCDYDRDGDLDLFLGQDNGGVNELYRNDANGTFTDVTYLSTSDVETPLAGLGTYTRGAAWADTDNDGDVDLFVASSQGVENNLYRNDTPTGNHWLSVQLVGTTSNRSAIGARVRIVAGGHSQVRWVEGGSGYRSQNSLVSFFGLGEQSVIDSLTVRWPNGQTQQVQTPLADRIVVVNQCVTGNPAIVTGSMTGWASSNPDPSFMTLHFRFRTSCPATQFEIRFRRANQTPADPWTYSACTVSGSQCLFSANNTLESLRSYSPCEYQKIEWQGRAANCNGWVQFGASHTFSAYCLQEP